MITVLVREASYSRLREYSDWRWTCGCSLFGQGVCLCEHMCSVPVCIATLYYENGSLFLWQLYNFLKGDFYCGTGRSNALKIQKTATKARKNTTEVK